MCARPGVRSSLPGAVRDEELEEGSSTAPAPHAILDAGGTSGRPLVEAVLSRMSDMVSGQVIQVISLEPQARLQLLDWCHQAGHGFECEEEHGRETWIWIRKTDPA